MRLRDFIKKHRQDIDLHIRAQCDNCRLNDREREMWIANDESLYLWARSEGVNV
jgi:hypothetical protein